MAKALIESLQLDLPALAKIIQSKGRKGDTILAHINPREAALLKKRGGSGTINPETGLPQFDDEIGGYVPSPEPSQVQPSSPVSPVYDVIQPGGSFTQAQGGTGQQYGGQAPISADVSATQPQAAGGNFQLPSFYDPSTSGLSVADMQAGSQPNAAQLADYRAGIAQQPALTAQQQSDLLAASTPTYGTQPIPTDQTPKDQAGKILGMSPDTLARLGLAGGLGLYGAGQYRKGVNQIGQSTQQQQAIAQPYQTAGQNLIRAAGAGELTPQSVQSYKAAQAQLAQGVANRGGVGAEQAATQLEAFRQTLLTNQYNYGLQVSQIGDQIALGAIRTGMQLDQQLNQASTNFYTSLAGIAAGLPMARTV
jgi:hypothetical protein